VDSPPPRIPRPGPRAAGAALGRTGGPGQAGIAPRMSQGEPFPLPPAHKGRTPTTARRGRLDLAPAPWFHPPCPWGKPGPKGTAAGATF
jgi:hypothetical protein